MRIQPYFRPANYFNRRACHIRSYTSQATFEPLRILFCGSDGFSIASLRALHKEHERDKALIESIDVVCRPAKPVGRGLKETREGKLFKFSLLCTRAQQNQIVPISLVAKELALSLHNVDTFTGWEVSVLWFHLNPIGFETHLATNTSWLANKFDHCRLVWSFSTSTNTSRSQIRRAQRPPFHIT